MQPMWICILSPKFFEDTYEETQTILEWWLFVILSCQFQFQFHNFYFQSIEITFENSGQTQKTEFSVAEEFTIIIM